jgi:hypothetical protein
LVGIGELPDPLGDWLCAPPLEPLDPLGYWPLGLSVLPDPLGDWLFAPPVEPEPMGLELPAGEMVGAEAGHRTWPTTVPATRAAVAATAISPIRHQRRR